MRQSCSTRWSGVIGSRSRARASSWARRAIERSCGGSCGRSESRRSSISPPASPPRSPSPIRPATSITTSATASPCCRRWSPPGSARSSSRRPVPSTARSRPVPSTRTRRSGHRRRMARARSLVERMLPWLEARGLRHVALRYFNAAGAEPDGSHGEHPAGASSLVPRVVAVAMGRQPRLTVFGDDYPTPGRDGDPRLRARRRPGSRARRRPRAPAGVAGRRAVLNLGTGTGSSVLEVVRAVERAAGVPVPLAMAPRRPGDVAAIWADSGEAERVLGWRATVRHRRHRGERRAVGRSDARTATRTPPAPIAAEAPRVPARPSPPARDPE